MDAWSCGITTRVRRTVRATKKLRAHHLLIGIHERPLRRYGAIPAWPDKNRPSLQLERLPSPAIG
jgi:hypothetical protein